MMMPLHAKETFTVSFFHALFIKIKLNGKLVLMTNIPNDCSIVDQKRAFIPVSSTSQDEMCTKS